MIQFINRPLLRSYEAVYYQARIDKDWKGVKGQGEE